MKTTFGSLIGAALLLALVPWSAVFTRADEAEEKAVKAIEKLGGRIARDMKAKDKPIVSVHLSFTQVTDAGLKDLAGLKQLQTLDLFGTQVTDAGLKHLAGLKRLRTLVLGSTQVTGKGKADLKKALPNLEIRTRVIKLWFGIPITASS